MASFIGFPDTVDERAARVVAGGVVSVATTALLTDRPWLLAPLAGGFAARVLTGPKLSPLARLATHVVVPRLPGPARPVPGPPKRLAQGMGLAMSTTSLVLAVRGRRRASRAVLSGLVVAAGLEAFAGICLACKMYPLLARLGLVSEDSCPDCANPWGRRRPATGTRHYHAGSASLDEALSPGF